MKSSLEAEQQIREGVARLLAAVFFFLLAFGLAVVGFKTAELQQGSAVPVKAGRK